MATLAQIEQALRAADAAGNTEDARRLAQAYAQQRDAEQQLKPAAQPVAPKPEPRTFGQEVGRSLGLGARGMIQGVYGLSGIVADPIMAGINKLGERAPTMSEVVRGEKGRRWGEQESSAQAGTRLADSLGLPKPATPMERISGDITSAVTGGGGLMGLGRQLATRAPGIAQGVGETLAAMPRTQIASMVGGAGASGATREAGGGQGAQVAASLLGGLSPAAIKTGGAMGLRGLARGGEDGIKEMKGRISAFSASGGSPSVGEATGGRLAQGLEANLAGLPGSVGVMSARQQSLADDIGSGVERIARTLSPRSTAGTAGLAAQRGIRGEGGFIEQRKAVATQLYDQVDQHMLSPSQAVDLPATRATLARLTSLTPGAESTSTLLRNPKIAQINQALGDDMLASQYLSGQQALPYSAVKELRSRVGRMMQGSELIAEAPKAEIKQLYGALSQDLEATARATSPQAAQAVSRANTYWKVLQKRVEIVEGAIEKNGGPEKVFSALWTGSRDGATTLRAVMQSLPQDGQRELTAAFVRRLGKAVNSAQDNAGEVFSTQTFLTNWNNISPEAKRVLFNRHGAGFSANMDKIAQTASILRNSGRISANPSGTATALKQGGTLGAFIVSILTGQAAIAGTIAAGATTANVIARVMTNPRVVAWIAKSTEMPVAALAQQVQVLKGVADRTGEQEIGEFADLLAEQGK